MDFLFIQQNVVTHFEFAIFFFSFNDPLFWHSLYRSFTSSQITFLNQKLRSHRCIDLLALARFTKQVLNHLFLVQVVHSYNAEFEGLFSVGGQIFITGYHFVVERADCIVAFFVSSLPGCRGVEGQFDLTVVEIEEFVHDLDGLLLY